ncbi:IS3 family transposase [Salinibacter ruber]|uniref:IS3 family transposase n=1 Tax=Salinibacter ruber TaxID=146919 RepID=UPI003C6E500F
MNCVREIIQEHPEYGYRRILPELEERTGQRVNHKRLRRLLSEHELALPRQMPKRGPSPVDKILEKASRSLNLVEGRKGDFLVCLQALVAPRQFLSCTGYRTASEIGPNSDSERDLIG